MQYDRLERFIQHQCKSLSQNTRKSYRSDIEVFLNNMSEKKSINSELDLLQSITNDDIEDWIESQEGKSFTTMDRRLIALKKFFNYITVNKKIIAFNPFDGINRVKPPKNITQAIKNNELYYKLKQKKIMPSIDEIKKIIDSTYIRVNKERNFKFASARDRFLISMLFTTGLRIEELLSVDLSQIKPYNEGEGYIIENIPSKTGVLKRVPIANKTLEYYKDYLSERNLYKNGNKSNYLVINESGDKWTNKDTNKRLTMILKKAEIDKHITCHGFRYAFKTYSTAKGINSDIIALVGGWKNDLSNQADTYLTNNGSLDKQIIEACNLL